ncbi:MAG: MATE family efflux transporter, partial [Deltaproteobacteria bacterium]|nr:MATE family efflux transporter [Deltaproteobacteria bacterium]
MSQAQLMISTDLPGEDPREPFLKIADPPPVRGWGHLGLNPRLVRHIVRVALPVVVGMLTQTAINILDTVMVGRLPKEIANPGQAGIGLALPMMWLVGGFLSSVWVGTQAITSRRAGEGNDRQAGRALTNSLLISTSTGFIFCLTAYHIAPPLIGALYADPTVVALGTDYLQIRLLGVLAMACTFSFKSFFDGIGRTRVFMVVAMIMNVTNVALNFLLIYGNETLGVPMLGVAGAAWASAIGAYTGLALLALWSFRPALVKRYHHYNPLQISVRVVREIIRLSLPNGLATVVVMVGFSTFYWIVGKVSELHNEVGN